MAETHVITTLSKKRAELSGDTYAIGQKRRRECVDVTSSQHPTAASEWSGQPKSRSSVAALAAPSVAMVSAELVGGAKAVDAVWAG